MPDIRVAFWNLGNLFDTTLSDMAADFEFTPEQGWNQATFDAKVANLAQIINAMFGNQGPDLLGICEVENQGTAEALIAAIGRPDLRLAHVDSPDIRGIDTALIYSTTLFEDPAPEDMVGHLIHRRYPTRDIFEVSLRLKASVTELVVLVNHWPSRKEGQYQSEPFRITVAEHCGRIVDSHLRLSQAQFDALPNSAAGLAAINARWDRNLLVMGDFNDEPFSRSLLDYLMCTRDLDHLEEEVKSEPQQSLPQKRSYLGKSAYLYNCMWPLLGRSDVGTLHFAEATNTMNLLDQFMVSRGLFYGKQGLRLDPASVAIFTASGLSTPKGRPRNFNRTTKQGFSDHFPITCILRAV